MHQIQDLQVGNLPAEFEFPTQTGTMARRLPGLSKINLFVGPNNSGKSRLVRELSKIDKPVFVPTCDLNSVRMLRDSFVAQIEQQLGGAIIDAGGIKSAARELPDYHKVTADFGNFEVFLQLARRAAELVENGLSVQHSSYGVVDTRSLVRRLSKLGRDTLDQLSALTKEFPEKWQFDRIYIPALRGLRTIGGSDVYVERTLKDYFTGTKSPPQLFSGLDVYNRVMNLLLGTLPEREVVAKLQRFLSENFFGQRPVALIPRLNDDLHVKIGDEKEQPIYNLGDGIAMILVIVFPLFLAEGKRVLAFIEEPELFLHPGLQRTLLRTLASFEQAQFFIATHSNHLLDLTTDLRDISVYAVAKELGTDGGNERTAKFRVEVAQSGHVGLLNSLGVRNSSVFLSNCTIWVEGITDRRYLRRYLRLFALQELGLTPDQEHLIPFKEDLHYSFVEYGGSNITHWSFLDGTGDPIAVDRLCGRLLLIADRDDSATKDERHEKLAQKLGERFVRLPRREIENLLTPAVLTEVVTTYEKEPDLFKAFDYEDYAEEPLGSFIEKNVLNTKKRRGSYAGESGTITDKLEFCDRALRFLDRADKLSPDAFELARRVYRFIGDHNPL